MASSCAIVTSLEQAREILQDLEKMSVDPHDVSVLLPDFGLDEDRHFGWLQYEDITAGGERLLASGPVLFAFLEAEENGEIDPLRAALEVIGLAPDRALEFEHILQDGHIFIGVEYTSEADGRRIQQLLSAHKAQELCSSRDEARLQTA